MNYPAYNTLTVERDEAIAIVRFNRPEALNAANIEMSIERVDLLQRISDDDSIRVLIMTGNERAYCAGGDVAAFARFSMEEAKEFAERGVQYQNILMNMPKPTIAAVSGFAFGGGFENVLLCDLRIAADTATFALPEINLGIFPGGGGTQRLVQNISISKAKELIFFGSRIDAQMAKDLGIVNRVVASDQLMVEAKLWASTLAQKSLAALAAAKQQINQAWGTPTSVGIKNEIDAWSQMYGTPDQKEGMEAFLTKRIPTFNKN